MDYFWIKQDKRYLHPPIINHVESIGRRTDFCLERESKIKDKNVVFADAPYPLDFIDVLDRQYFLVSENVCTVFRLYNPSIKYKFFCVLNNKLNEYASYFAPIFVEIDAIIPEQSEITPDKSFVKKLMLSKTQIKNEPIFKLAGLNTDTVIVRLDVAESMLRRSLKGVEFLAVKMV